MCSRPPRRQGRRVRVRGRRRAVVVFVGRWAYRFFQRIAVGSPFMPDGRGFGRGTTRQNGGATVYKKKKKKKRGVLKKKADHYVRSSTATRSTRCVVRCSRLVALSSKHYTAHIDRTRISRLTPSKRATIQHYLQHQCSRVSRTIFIVLFCSLFYFFSISTFLITLI